MDNQNSPVSNIDVLWSQAQQAVQDFSAQTWPQTGEHDPGITLLEGMTDKVNELIKWQSSPIEDLLISPSEIDGSFRLTSAFPENFGPENMLTCGPITLDDYRKVLFDLHSRDDFFKGDFTDNFFFFADIYIEKESFDERYKYYYDKEKYIFKFKTDDSSYENHELKGNYTLLLVPSEHLQNNENLLNKAKKLFLKYLSTIENTGERFTEVRWLEKGSRTLKLDIEVEENICNTDIDDIAKIYNEIYHAIRKFAHQPVKRYATSYLKEQGFTNEGIYCGPFLKHGWIPNLIPIKNYKTGYKANLSHLIADIQAITGVKTVKSLIPLELEIEIEAGQYLSFGTGTGALRFINLFNKDNLALDTPFDRIGKEVFSPITIDNLKEPVALGHGLIDFDYVPMTETIPDCYHLMTYATNDIANDLHQFLLPIEQMLANENARLRLLPGLLDFDQRSREGDTNFWGNQWPFGENHLTSNQAHQDYKDVLEEYSLMKGKDYAQTVASLQYLMGYFNEVLGPNLFSKPDNEYIKTQRELLNNIPDNQYRRAAYKNIEDRIAAKIGLESKDICIFDNRKALPILPNPNGFDDFLADVEEIDGRLKFTLGHGSSYFLSGMLVKVSFRVINGDSFFPIDHLMIDEVIGNELFIVIQDTQLAPHIEGILVSNNVVLSATSEFLADVPFRIISPDNSNGSAGEVKVICAPFPALAKVGDEITLSSLEGTLRFNNTDKYEITEIDRFNHSIKLSGVNDSTVIKDTQFWYLKKPEKFDRFSFKVSIAINKNTLSDRDKYQWKEVETWLKEILDSDLPINCEGLIYWLDNEPFTRFQSKLQGWAEQNFPIGSTSYEILETLALGRKPTEEDGVGFSLVITPEQESEKNQLNTDEQKTYIEKNDILNVEFT